MKRGRSRISWRRTIGSNMKAMQQTCGSLTKLARIGRSAGSLLLPYTPPGVKDNDDDDNIKICK
jgi:hypothetical protein